MHFESPFFLELLPNYKIVLSRNLSKSLQLRISSFH